MIEGLQPYPEYKESGLPWLGQVPSHWNLRRTKASVTNVVDQTTLMELGEVYVALENIESWTGRVRPQSGSNLFTGQVKRFRPNDVLFGKLRPYLAKITRLPVKGVCVGELFVLRPRNNSIIPEYLELLLRAKSTIDVINSSTFGAKMPRADWQFVGNLRLNFPPPDEQAAIVRFLDHANRKIDGFIRAKRKLIALLNEQKQAIIHRAVTRGLDPSVPLRPSGIPWLGDIPEHWEVKKLRFLFRYAKGNRAAELTNEYIGHNPGEFPVFSGQTEHGGLMGKISWHEFDFPSPVVFVSTVGARAMTTRILSGKFSLSQNCALIISKSSQANSIYFENVFQRLFAFERHSISQIMQPSLRFADLNRFYVPHPPVKEQEAIAEEIEHECSKLTTAIARAEREIALMQEYRTRLTADVVTGKLDVRPAAAKLPDLTPSTPETATDEAPEESEPGEEAE